MKTMGKSGFSPYGMSEESVVDPQADEDAMRSYSSRYPLQTQEMDVAVAAAGEYRTLLERLNSDGLPRFEARFKDLLNKETIKERIERINQSLTHIDYNPGRFIALQAQPTNDAEVWDFQTDVRNWFVFAASECWREDGKEHEHYSDSGGKSGGQKEKLAYTILAASFAYQFGLVWGETRSRSFRFVVIDEAFGRGSDVSVQYGLKLFEQINLQLLIVTPLQKIHIIEPFVSSVGFVYNEEGRASKLHNLTIEAYREQKALVSKVSPL